MAKPEPKTFKDYTALGSISAHWILHNLPFVFFLGFLAIIYIANAHYAERQVRQIQTLQKEIKDLRREHNALKSEVMDNSRLSKVGKRVEELGLKKSAGKAKKIVIE